MKRILIIVFMGIVLFSTVFSQERGFYYNLLIDYHTVHVFLKNNDSLNEGLLEFGYTRGGNSGNTWGRYSFDKISFYSLCSLVDDKISTSITIKTLNENERKELFNKIVAEFTQILGVSSGSNSDRVMWLRTEHGRISINFTNLDIRITVTEM